MDAPRTPPLTALRSFEAAARLGSLSAAARELNVTHAAVAQQVRRLESWFGVKLLTRAGRGVETTERGAALAAGLSEGFGVIAATVRRFAEDDDARALRITTTPSFASGWLMPQLAAFRETEPEIELMINPTVETIDLIEEDYDVGFRFGRGDWPGLQVERLLATNEVLVASTALLERHPIATPADVATAPWVQELGTDEIRHWLLSHGVDASAHRQVLNLPGPLALDAVRRGHGLAMTARAWVREDIEAGRMVALFEEEQDPALGYYMVARPQPHRRPLAAFLKWARQALAAQSG